MSPKIAIIGYGIMGKCILSGLLAAGAYQKENFIVTVRRPDVNHEDDGLETTADSVGAIAQCDTVILWYQYN